MQTRPFLLACATSGVLALLAQVSGCAEPSEELGQPSGTGTAFSTSSSTSTSGSSSSGGGEGGASSSSSSSSGGGEGGASSSSSSSSTASSGAGGAGGEGGAGGAGPTDTVLLFAGGGPDLVGGEFHPASGWVTASVAEQTTHGTAVALVDGSAGVALFRSSSMANTSKLMYVTWNAGAWGAPMLIGGAVVTQNRPAIVAASGKAHVVYHGNNFNHYYLVYDPSMASPWPAPVENIGPAGSPSFGPTPPSVTVFGGNPVAAYAGANNNLYDHTRDAAGWSAGYSHFNNMPPFLTATPAIVTLSQGNEMMIVFLQSSNNQIYWTRGSGASWTAPAVLDANAFSNEPVALVALPAGEAAMAYRGQNGQLYTSRYTPAGSPAWSAPAPLSNPNVSIVSPPSLAPGVGGALAEMAYVDATTGAAYHSRLMGNGWTAAQLVGGAGLYHAAITAPP